MKNFWKKTAAGLLALLIVTGSTPFKPVVDQFGDTATIAHAATATSGQCGDNAYWNFNPETAELVISGTGDMYDFSSSSIPWNDYKASIRSVTVKKGITSISARSFAGFGDLRSLSIPNSVTTLGENMLAYTNGLESITVPGSVESFARAFSCCMSLKSVTLCKGITKIDDEAFDYCKSLTSIRIPDGVTSIGDSAFYGCYSLESVMIPGSVRSICKEAFKYCESLESITIPFGVEFIGYEAFSRCSALKTAYLPGSLTEINSSAFTVSGLEDLYFDGLESPWIRLAHSNYSVYFPSGCRFHFNDQTPTRYKCGENAY